MFFFPFPQSSPFLNILPIFIPILFLLHHCPPFAATLLPHSTTQTEELPPSSLPLNWTVDYSNALALVAFDFAAAAYSSDPALCLAKNGAILVMRASLPCDPFGNECWAFIALSPRFIVMSVRGTRTHAQLIIEIIESMTEPKKRFPAGGSVQHYFYESMQIIWNAGFGQKLAQLKRIYPNLPVLFTGHSLGGALASLTSTQFASENNATVKPSDILLITFGQPRVGNIEYAHAHDRLVPNSFRLVHRYDLVPHLPYCYERLRSPHRCIPLHNHGPFHHGTEIWYPAEDMDAQNAPLFAICDGRPFGEDQNCSNAHFVRFQVRDHLFYFGKDVEAFGIGGCRPNGTTTMGGWMGRKKGGGQGKNWTKWKGRRN